MAPAKAATEPSMEEILASIRQIIADEDTPETGQANDQAAIDDAFDSIDVGDEEMSADDVDALFDAPAAPAQEENDQAAIDAAFGAMGDGDEEMSADDVDALFDSPNSDGDDGDDDDDVLALSADQFADPGDVSFDAIEDFNTAMEDEPVAPMPAGKPASAAKPDGPLVSSETANSVMASFGALNSAMTVSPATTIEDLMRSMMRPMLKQWLDDNLPQMVERLVKAEIERMSRQ